MLQSIWEGFCRALKASLISSIAWTVLFGAILWFFSKPSIPYVNFLETLAPYSFAFFGAASILFELLLACLEEQPPGKLKQS